MNFGEIFSAIRAVVIPWDDLRWGAKATLARSFGLHLVAMASCGIGLACGRVALLEHARSTLRTAELERNISKEYEPRRDEKLPALNSALLGDLSTWSLCDSMRSDDPSIARQAQRIGRVVDQGAEEFARTYLRLPSFPPLPDLARIMPQIEPRNDVYIPRQCISQPDGAGLNVHLRWAQASLFVPSYTAAWSRFDTPAQAIDCSALEHAIDHSSLAPEPKTLAARLVDDARAAVDAMSHLNGFTAHATGDAGPREVRLNSAYFISYSGYMITNPRENAGSINSIDWLGGDYVRRATQLQRSEIEIGPSGIMPAAGTGCQSALSAYGRMRHQSRTYLDIFGSGAVTTHCYPVGERANPGAAQRPGGVFCVDVSVPRQRVHQHVFTQSIFDVGLLRGRPEMLRESDLAEGFYCQPPGCTSGPVRADPTTTVTSAGSIPWTVARRVFREYIHQTSRDESQVTSVLFDGVEYQIARVWRGHNADNERSTDWVILRAPDEHGFWFFSGLALALLFAGFAATAVAFRQTLDSHGREWGPVRRLDAGFLVADEHDRLVRANDRCEEILNKRLPIVGTDPFDWSKLHPGTLGANDYFDTPVKSDRGGQYEAHALLEHDGALEAIPFDKLGARRMQGIRDEYFVRVRSGHYSPGGVNFTAGIRENWYRASANFALPFRPVGGDKFAPVTFLTLTSVSDGDWSKIQEFYAVSASP